MKTIFVVFLLGVLLWSVSFFVMCHVSMWWYKRTVRNRNLLLGLDIYLGGTEGNKFNEETSAALERVKSELLSLGVRCEKLHNKAANNLRTEHFWLDGVAETSSGRADVVIVGDWRIMRDMDNHCLPPHHTLYVYAYRSNGYQIDFGRSEELKVSKWRPQWLTQWLLTRMALRTFLKALSSCNKPAPDPGFCYDTSKWPYTADDGTLPPTAA